MNNLLIPIKPKPPKIQAFLKQAIEFARRLEKEISTGSNGDTYLLIQYIFESDLLGSSKCKRTYMSPYMNFEGVKKKGMVRLR